MRTEVLVVDAAGPDPATIARAAAILQSGGLVAFPTETVYGLGANALDVEASRRIFAAKGRPAHNPVIVHVDDVPAARALATHWPATAQRLAERFWPGPLTLVLPRSDRVAPLITAGGPTVAVRVPAHPVALALLRACRLPLAAPSANRSGLLSPTRAEHVLAGLAGRIDLLLDAGPVSGGIESTVLDVSTDRPRLLRPGLITPAQLEEVVGPIARMEHEAAAAPLRSPGMLERHYAPVTPLECVSGEGGDYVRDLRAQGLRIGWLTFATGFQEPGDTTRVLPREPGGYAAELYAALHEFDAAGLDRIVVDLPPATEEWLAIHDRLRRARTR
jgi:L-threonylcarbamoyladenylate synthase